MCSLSPSFSPPQRQKNNNSLKLSLSLSRGPSVFVSVLSTDPQSLRRLRPPNPPVFGPPTSVAKVCTSVCESFAGDAHRRQCLPILHHQAQCVRFLRCFCPNSLFLTSRSLVVFFTRSERFGFQ